MKIRREVTKGPNSLGYFKVKIRKKPGNGWFNPSDTNPETKFWTKFKETTCFPNDWTKKKIQEELSLAFVSKRPTNHSNQFEGILSDGVIVIFTVDGNKITSAYPSIPKETF